MAEISNGDREAMKQARSEVLDKLQPNAMSAWKDDSTGHSGEVQLRRVYEKNGMTCADVDHMMKVPQARHYLAPFCRTADGTWMAAF
jgi:surface antigen